VGYSAKTTPKITTLHDDIALLRTVINNRNRLFYLESTSASCLHVRMLCPVSPQRLQRLCDSSPTLTRTLFFTFYLFLRAANSFLVVSYRPSAATRAPSRCIRFLLCNLRRVAASLATLSLALRFVSNTIKCAIIAAPLLNFSIAFTIDVGELSTCL
jgi:hypothetical protein